MIIRQKTKINITNKFEDYRFRNGTKKFLNNIYVFEFGMGCQKQFLVSKKSYRIGQNYLCLDNYDEKYEIPNYFIEKIYKDGTFKYLMDYGSVYKTMRRTNVNLKGYNLRETFNKYLLEGSTQMDDNLLWIMCGLMLKPDGSKIRTNQWMPYAPHGLIYTNPKVGKSSMASKVGMRVERASIPRLLGFRTKGDLDGMEEPMFLDEVQEYKTDNTFSQILSYEEDGTTTTVKGSKSIVTEGYAPLVYMGNCHSMDYKQELRNILDKISYNREAFISRKAFIYVNYKCVTRQGNRDRNPEIDAIVEDLVEYLKPIISKAFIEHSDILEIPTTDYAFRHVNGFALLQTLIDYGSYDYDTFAKNISRVKRINENAFKK